VRHSVGLAAGDGRGSIAAVVSMLELSSLGRDALFMIASVSWLGAGDREQAPFQPLSAPGDGVAAMRCKASARRERREANAASMR
jgi:hypothetical protein